MRFGLQFQRCISTLFKDGFPSAQMILIGTEDLYGGVKLKSSLLEDDVKKDFEKHLDESVASWIELKKRGVWFQVELQDSHLIPILVSKGFVFHHAQERYVMMNKWLPNTLNTLPKYAHTNIGVGGIVVDPQGRVLLMREKKGIYLGWKFPGGLSDPGENIYDTAVREVFEETGVKAVPKAVLLFRQVAVSQWKDVGDIYFICAMELVNPEENTVTACPHEAEEARWFTREEISALESTKMHTFHHTVLEKYDEWAKSGRKGCHKADFPAMRGYPVNMFYID